MKRLLLFIYTSALLFWLHWVALAAMPILSTSTTSITLSSWTGWISWWRNMDDTNWQYTFFLTGSAPPPQWLSYWYVGSSQWGSYFWLIWTPTVGGTFTFTIERDYIAYNSTIWGNAKTILYINYTITITGLPIVLTAWQIENWYSNSTQFWYSSLTWVPAGYYVPTAWTLPPWLWFQSCPWPYYCISWTPTATWTYIFTIGTTDYSITINWLTQYPTVMLNTWSTTVAYDGSATPLWVDITLSSWILPTWWHFWNCSAFTFNKCLWWQSWILTTAWIYNFVIRAQSISATYGYNVWYIPYSVTIIWPTITPPVPPIVTNQWWLTANSPMSGIITLPVFTDINTPILLLTYSISWLPTGLVFDPLTNIISGTPTTSWVSTVTYTANNGTNASSVQFTITVNIAMTAYTWIKEFDNNIVRVVGNISWITSLEITTVLKNYYIDKITSMNISNATPTTSLLQNEHRVKIWTLFWSMYY